MAKTAPGKSTLYRQKLSGTYEHAPIVHFHYTGVGARPLSTYRAARRNAKFKSRRKVIL